MHHRKTWKPMCLAYGSKEAVLIYPETDDFPKLSWCTDNDINGSEITVRAMAVDLSLDEDALILAFSEIIKNTNFYMENFNG